MMHQDPHRSIVPNLVWAEVEAWLAARYRRGARSQRPGCAYPQAAMVRENQAAPPIREEAVSMGGLIGILAEPTQPSMESPFPAILLHNVGANSHVGPNRLYVRMARRWAALGFRVLRFDTTGLGDSPASGRTPENRVYSATAPGDSLRAMDFLAQTRATPRFVLMGLCSGASVSFHAALADRRVAALVLMNILVFDWKEGDSVDARRRQHVKSTRFYSRAFWGRQVWARLIRGEVNVTVIAHGLLKKAWARVRYIGSRAMLGEGEVALGLRSLIGRGTDVLLVFDAEDGGRDVVDAHLGTNAARLQHSRGFHFEVIEGTDHTFSPLWAQEHLLSMLTRHLLNLFATTRVSNESS
jgi:hypothetical protein